MEAVLIAINKILDIKIVQWGLLIVVVIMLPTLSVKMYWYKYDNAILKSTVADFGAAIEVQNREVKRLGETAKAFEENYKQADTQSKKIAVEGQKTLQKLLDAQFTGTCDDKVKQAMVLVKGVFK